MAQTGSEHIDRRIILKQGDITALEVGAIVNAANHSLLGGGGVDGAIHKAAGPALKTFNEKLGGCATGDAKISPGFKLKAHHVISTVGPVWSGGKKDEDHLLASCYRRCMEVASAHKITTIAFPSISTGIYGFPFERAEKIALKTINDYLLSHDDLEEVILITHSLEDYQSLKAIYEAIAQNGF